MPDILDLFSTLEGWEDFPEQLLTSPDEPIRKARLALNGQYDLKDALTAISEQLRIFRQTWRAFKFDIVQPLNPSSDTSPEKFKRMGTELNQLAALLCMRLDDPGTARYHLMSALACDPDNADTAFYLVEFYEQAGEFKAAFDQLDKTFGDTNRFDRYFQLFRLCGSIQEKSTSAAASCLERLAVLPGARQYGKLAQHAAGMLKGIGQPLPEQAQASLLQQGMESIHTQDFDQAYACFSALLDENPMKGYFWYLTGEALSSIALTMTGSTPPEKDLRRQRLLDTVQALQTAVYLEPAIPGAYEVLIQCHMQLRDAGAALLYAQVAIKELPENTTLQGLYARTLLFNGDRQEAEALAQQVQAADPGETYSATTLEALLTR
ncbi:MAG: tetratricopeptide repeat protein [Bacteroidota bacterium]